MFVPLTSNMEQGAASRMESVAVVLFVWLLQYSFGTSFEGCESPQYLQYRRSGVIHCSFDANTSAVFWYDSPNIVSNKPIVTLIDSVKGGEGYKSGEFDITSSGSLLIPDVNTNHGKNFSVATFTSLDDDEPSVYFIVVVIAGVHLDRCDSPQYLEYGGTGIINCRFQTNFYGVFWYNSTQTVFDQPILTYTQSVKGGRAYESGEFDVFPNGSLIVREVRLVHEHTYTVAKFTSQDEDPTFLAVVAIVIVKSLNEGPLIDKCEKDDSICFIQLDGSSEVGCTVHGTRPAASLKWLTRTGYGDRNISYEVNLISSNVTFTSHVITSEYFAHSPILSLLVCKAEFVPGVLQRDESLVLVQNNYKSLSSVPAVVKYAQRDSTLELHCTTNEISFLVWTKSLPLNSNYQNLVFATFIEHRTVTKYENYFKLTENGSLMLSHIDLPHEGFYGCIYGDGITGGMANYQVITYVIPVPVYPVVKGCKYKRNCVLEVHRKGTLTCSVNGIRPEVNLEWKVSSKTQSRSISFFDHKRVTTTSGETFNITLTSSYSVGSVKQVTVECGVSDGDIFPVKSRVQLLFHPDITKQKECSPSPAIIIVIVVVVIVAAGLILFLRKAYRHHMKKARKCKTYFNKQELARQEANPMFQVDIEGKNLLRYESYARQFCSSPVVISNSIAKFEQEFICSFLNLASGYMIPIPEVVLMDTFKGVDIPKTSLLLRSEVLLPAFVTLKALTIHESGKTLTIESFGDIARYKEWCPRLEKVTFSHCLLPWSLQSPCLSDLQTNRVRVVWSFTDKEYYLNLKSGLWEIFIGQDGSHKSRIQLTEEEYQELIRE